MNGRLQEKKKNKKPNHLFSSHQFLNERDKEVAKVVAGLLWQLRRQVVNRAQQDTLSLPVVLFRVVLRVVNKVRPVNGGAGLHRWRKRQENMR